MLTQRTWGGAGILSVLAILTAIASSEACTGKEDDGGGHGGSPSPLLEEDCRNEIDDDKNGDVDCHDVGCKDAPSCVVGGNNCGEQIPTCESNWDGSINQICKAGLCAPAGPQKPNANLKRGDMLIRHTLRGVSTDRIGSYFVRVYHPEKPQNGMLRCSSLLSTGSERTPPDDPSQVNFVLRLSGQFDEQADILPVTAFGMPITEEGRPFVVFSQFYSASRDLETREPRGELLGVGCEEGLIVPEGSFQANDPNRTFEMVVGPSCTSDNDTCLAPKKCDPIEGACRDPRCEPACENGFACREWNATPECLRLCDVDNPRCQGNDRCDATQGEVPVCVPP